MGIFYLKHGDTLPVLEVDLLNPDGTDHIASGVLSAALHILREDGVLLEREMELVQTSPTRLRYAWSPSDWDTSNPNGYLLNSVRHLMEYELLGPANARATFPNGPATGRCDVLCIIPDLADTELGT